MDGAVGDDRIAGESEHSTLKIPVSRGRERRGERPMDVELYNEGAIVRIDDAAIAGIDGATDGQD